jgi:putative ABC transport system permease protein
MDAFIRDVRYGARMLLKDRAFTALGVLALALGIGAATAVFTVVDAVLLRPLPYADPGRLVVALRGPTANGPVSPADYLDYRRDARSFERLSAAQAWTVTLSGGERPERITGLKVSADMFDLLGVSALAGRTFVAGEDGPGRDRVVALGHGLWQRRFGGDRAVIGQTISLDGQPYLVVGIMPPSFRFAPFWQTRAEIWAPLDLTPRLDDRGGASLRLFGRVKHGVTVADAQAELSAIDASLALAHPTTNTGVRVTVRPLLDTVVSGIRPTLVALMGMVTFVLLIACANVANTRLARASGRQREIALRTALGASGGQVVRQLLTESLLLAGIGAAGGLALALLGVQWLTGMLPPGSLPRQQEVVLDLRVFGAAAIATIFTGVAAGLAPAMQLLRGNGPGLVQDRERGATEGANRKGMRGVIIAGEMALALVLMAGAGLMGRTLLKLTAVDPGFRVDHVAVATVSLAGTPHAEPPARHAMFVRLRQGIGAIPGVRSVSAINHLPLAGDIWTLGYRIDGRPTPPAGQGLSAVYRIVQPGYFEVMGLPVAGRDFSERDSNTAPPVAIVNRAMAERRWPGENPVGRRIYLPGISEVQAPITIVGVAANARQSEWTGAPNDEVYLSYAQRSGEFGLHTLTFVVHTSVDPGTIAAAIPREVVLIDRGVTVSDTTTLEAIAADELWRERLTAGLTGSFAVIALGLAVIGLYAVVACSVARRTREFGVRLALGATAGHVQRLALAESLRPVVIGAATGLLLALIAGRLVRTLLFEVSAVDPLAVGGAAFALLVVAAMAAWLPARRAGRVDPIAALRQE